MITLFAFISFIIGKPFYRFLSFVSVVWFLTEFSFKSFLYEGFKTLFFLVTSEYHDQHLSKINIVPTSSKSSNEMKIEISISEC